MSKVFRLYKEGTTTYEDWNNSPAFPYNSASRDTIEDPDGASACHEITSIPSPFARIDLIKAAFKEVCKSGKNNLSNLDGNTIFHKMVSDTLDVAEIFFNIDKFNGKVEIIKWDWSIMLTELDQSGISGHRYFADALRKYMSSDSKTYNFEALRNIYLLNYVEGPDELNIIGATSPATLFFSNANDLGYVNDIFFGEDKPFDSNYQPLYRRDFEFVKYFFALRKNIPNFAGLFPEFDTYLTKTFSAITDQRKKNELLSITSTVLDQLSSISVVDVQQNDIVEVLGYPLYKKTSRPVTTTSDFTIKTTKECEFSPLVLPIEAGNRYGDLQYTTSKWGKTNVAPYIDSELDLMKRTLPFDGSLNPYLTISDLLEDTIIRVPHSLNVENYFDGNLKLEEKELSYLLPLKPLLFEYFTPEEIRGNMMDGKPMFEMQTLAGNSGVKVTLRVPIKGAGNIRYVEYIRLYYNNRCADVQNNEGGMTEFKFTGFIMPQVRFNNEQDAIYTVSCVQSATGRNEFRFFSDGEKILPKSCTCRNEDQQIMVKADNYLLEKRNFDFVQVRNTHGYCGILLPIFKQQRNVERFEFAIDLGTSNTHIELRKGNEKPEVFTFTAKDRQLCEMFIPIKNEYGSIEDLIEETELIEKDFIPSEIGLSDFHFPTRTVLSCAKTIDWTNVVEPFTLVNLPFTYDKRSELSYNNFRCNIKWGNGDDLCVMESYVRCLMLIIRNKVLLNNGDLQHTKITWFYPISMAPKRLRRLKSIWDDAYQKYFGNGVTGYMTESSAPIQYFFKRYSTATDLINVDIGGGTTDIAFAKDKNISHVTSFRFASNTLFENSFLELDEDNGIVDWHKNEILKLLEEKNLMDLIRVFNSPNNTKPANMASFLFGLKDNTIPQRAGVNVKAIDFNYILQEDEDFKIVFIIFYTAIVYHIAQIVKSLNLEVPRHISFSGNGSKVIRVITTDSKLLARYTKMVFEKLLGKPYGKELDLLGLEKDSNPKESTCKGGIIGTEDEDNRDKTIVFKSDCTGLVTPKDTYANIKDDYKRRTVTAVEDFFKFVLVDMNSAFNFDKNFGVKPSSIRIAQEMAKKDLLTFLEKGISQRCEETEAEDMIEETFFYYPIKGVLNAISAEIYNELQQS
ncbi:cell division FtsA domain-containing protein [Parabacteroides distasonis]|uniref:cell division protein FtsA n=1 Tax=Parabacteroides distasonis TaxID=823 RepID=UPI001D1242F5|nr:cell division protein FtsA [Parabacteroides distasonis]MCC2779712.1 cell division FtsA domain-containing protein [Parabacteroides distasonis]MCQ5181524.1 cell division FtsA domain-containing protein [Parabacteroides distasonis]